MQVVGRLSRFQLFARVIVLPNYSSRCTFVDVVDGYITIDASRNQVLVVIAEPNREDLSMAASHERQKPEFLMTWNFVYSRCFPLSTSRRLQHAHFY